MRRTEEGKNSVKTDITSRSYPSKIIHEEKLFIKKKNLHDNIQIIISRSGAGETTLTSISSRPSKISLLTRLLILQVFLGLVPLLPSPNLPLVVLEVAIYLE